MNTNHTTVTYFIVTGISEKPELQVLIFFLVILIYLITLGGNITILLLICLDHHLHTPMYFFLANLSVVDISCSTITLHKILLSFLTGDKKVPFIECMFQTYMFGSLAGHELFILTAMSFDRYVAICNPLNYHKVMSRRTCISLASFCWLLGFIQVVPYSVLMANISCYSTNEINHFCCDLVPIIGIACSDVSILKALTFIQGIILFIITPFCLTFISYVFIITTILKIRSSSGRRKAFYTCSSHLMVIILLYMTLILQYAIPSQYLAPNATGTLESKKLYALFNTAAIPLLNPLIYSLKNKDVKAALRRMLNLGRVIT
ncbi:unnamed protein product [Staurois parvus]|uniref:G-protein coupled receptors family 1 profile domain-containing protein n=1 Tax=Staurois parvus TaxID=386267 RepID=A0ABN9E1G4_9NEOB|nr:unnamed protein product [Staurois parvus]